MLAGVLVGFGFLTKMMQALLIVPGLALVYLFAGPNGLWRRFKQLARREDQRRPEDDRAPAREEAHRAAMVGSAR